MRNAAVCFRNRFVRRSGAVGTTGEMFCSAQPRARMYYFRQVIYNAADADGDLSNAIAIFGNIAFSEHRDLLHHQRHGERCQLRVRYGLIPLACYLGLRTSSSCSTTAVSGTYSFAFSGQGFLSSPIYSSDLVYGLVSSNGILIGSSTENANANNPYNDLFIAAPVGGQHSEFFGRLHDGRIFSQRHSLERRGCVLFPASKPEIRPQSTSRGITAEAEPPQSPHHAILFEHEIRLQRGRGMILPFSDEHHHQLLLRPNLLFHAGPRVSVSADRLTVTTSWWAFAATPPHSIPVPSTDTAGLDLDTSTLASGGYATADSFYGSFSSTNGSIIEADRVFQPGYAAEVSTYGDSTTDTAIDRYTFTNGGTVQIGVGVGPYLGNQNRAAGPEVAGIQRVQRLCGPNQPARMQAVMSPFTAGISPGEF